METEHTNSGVLIQDVEQLTDSVDVLEDGRIQVNFERYILSFQSFDHFERFFYLTKEAYEALRGYNETKE